MESALCGGRSCVMALNNRTPEFDHRLFLISGYLQHFIPGKTILDLNCGQAPLYWKLRPEFNFYLATDKQRISIQNSRPLFQFRKISDHLVPAYLEQKNIKVDILLVLGYDAYLNEFASVSLPETINTICAQQMPELVVFDAADRLPARCDLGPTLGRLTQKGYTVECSWYVRPRGQAFSPDAERQIYIMRREM